MLGPYLVRNGYDVKQVFALGLVADNRERLVDPENENKKKTEITIQRTRLRVADSVHDLNEVWDCQGRVSA